MIRLHRTPCPTELDAAVVAQLTSEFQQDRNKRVWNQTYIKDALKAMSNNKCCYCETDITEEAKYLEVEHYECKDVHSHKVVEWLNLLPSCKRCNTEKGTYDVVAKTPIIDPSRMNPKEYIFLKDNYRFGSRNPIGRATVEELYLNDSARMVIKRFKIGEAVIQALDKITDDLTRLSADPQSRRLLNKVRRSLLAALNEAGPQSVYSATAATCLLKSTEYRNIRETLIHLNLWSSDLSSAHTIAVEAALLE